MGKFTVDYRLLPVKLHYLIFFTALACALPFRTVQANQLGISGTEIGIVFLVIPIIKIFSDLMFGTVLDYFKTFRLCMTVLVAITAIAHALMALIPAKYDVISYKARISANYDNRTTTHCPNVQVIQSNIDNFTQDMDQYCKMHCDFCTDVQSNLEHGKYMHTNCTQDCNKPQNCRLSFIIGSNKFLNTSFCNEEIVYNVTTEVFDQKRSRNGSQEDAEENDSGYITEFHCSGDIHLDCTLDFCSDQVHQHRKRSSTGYSMQFWLFLVLMIASATSFNAVIFSADTVCYEVLGKKINDYGWQRLWGAVGWGVGALFGGYFNSLFQKGDTIDYSPSFYLLGAIALLDLIPVYYLKVEDVTYSKNILKDICRLLHKPAILGFLSMAYFVGILSGLIWNYELWYLQDLNASHVLLGLSQASLCLLGELPAFIFSGWIIKTFGHIHCNSITLLCFGLRYLGFVYMKNPWLCIPLGIIHGPTFGVFFASLTMYAKLKSPPGTEATVQALTSVVFEGLGVATGNILGGIGFDKVGGRTTFLYAAILSFILLFINVSYSVGRTFSKKKVLENTQCQMQTRPIHHHHGVKKDP